MLRWLLAAVMALGLSAAVSASPAAFRSVDQWQRTLYTARDGAPQGIYTFTQDRQGYLWLGGSNGLYRFDGVHFQRMFEGKLAGTLISALFTDESGDIWIGDVRGNVTRLHEGILIPMNRGTAFTTVMAFTQRPNGSFWMGTSNGLVAFDGKDWRRVGISTEVADETLLINLYGRGADGSYWVFAGNDAFRSRPGTDRFEKIAANDGMAAMAALPQGTTFSGTTATADMIVDRSGALWVPTTDGLLRLHGEPGRAGKSLATEHIRSGDGSEDISATADFVDKDGNVWIASSRGLEQFRTGAFTPLTLPAGTFRPTIAADNDGVLWIASQSMAPPLRVAGTIEPHPELGVFVTTLSRAPDGAVWMSGDDALRRFRDGTVTSLPLPPAGTGMRGNGPLGRGARGLAVDAQNHVWLNLFTKLWHWDGHAWSEALPHPADSLAIDGSGAWVGGQASLSKLGGEGDPRRYTSHDGITIGAINALYTGRDGLWMGGTDGLLIKRGERFQRLLGVGGERFNGTADVVELPTGDLWVLTSRGAYRIAAAEIAAAMATPDHAVHYTLFDQNDGLRGSIGTLQSDPLEPGTDGRLWVASERSVAWIDPAHLPVAPAPPPVSIESLNGKDLRFAGGKEVTLEKGTRSIEVTYTAATLSVPERSRFRYVLHGIDDGWQDGGEQRSAHYSNLDPGHYIFLAESSNADGVWQATASSLFFEILPAFYQTGWFKALCVLVALMVAWSLYRMHLARIYAGHQARLRERERIARDLHDCLLQYFQAVLLHAHAASVALAPGKAKDKLEKVIEVAGDALVEGRDKIMGLRSVNDSLDNLPKEIARLAELLGDVHPMTCSVEVHGEPRPLRPAVADEVHAISHELVANAFRHSQGTHVKLDLHYERSALLAVVTDDGRGIDGDGETPAREGSWGLAGMRERARQVGGSLVIGRGPDGGTRATLRVPGRVAYTRVRSRTTP